MVLLYCHDYYMWQLDKNNSTLLEYHSIIMKPTGFSGVVPLGAFILIGWMVGWVEREEVNMRNK